MGSKNVFFFFFFPTCLNDNCLVEDIRGLASVSTDHSVHLGILTNLMKEINFVSAALSFYKRSPKWKKCKQ